jgi:transcriptional regulator with XRE-family HTH domain
MTDRIQLILKVKNISPSQFADEIGVQRSGISHILTGRNKPSLDFVTKVLQAYPEINPDWLLFGKGQMVTKLQEQERTEVSKEDTLSIITENAKTFKTLFDADPEFTAIAKKEEKKPPLLSAEVERIIVFYKNKTFSEYCPK